MLTARGHGSRYFGAPQVIVIEDSWGYVFGGVVTPAGWQLSQRRYFGDGESFVFAFEPSFRAWAWQGTNDYFAIGDTGSIGMGGGGGGFAFCLDEMFDNGTSAESATFGNAVLASSKEFKCLSVEVYALRTGL